MISVSVLASRGNLFGDAASSFGGSERETLCELCGYSFPHPVTYHMREFHSGCGRHAGGLGYNSGGNYCGGWAGNCGDGGMGGSTWYLMCDLCRERYLREKKHGQRERGGNSSGSNKKSKKRISAHHNACGTISRPTHHTSSDISALESHIVMKNNAIFLLDFASASTGLNIPRGHHTKQKTWQASYSGTDLVVFICL